MKNKYLNLKNTNNENVFEVLDRIITNNTFIESIGKLREEFPMLNLDEAKEILIIYSTEYESLDQYQKEVYYQLKQGNIDLK